VESYEGFLKERAVSASVPLNVSQTVLAVPSRHSMKIPIVIESHMSKKTTEANALIDSGAAGEFIDWKFVRKFSINKHSVSSPIPIKNVDGSNNSSGKITHYCILFVRIGEKVTSVKFYVTELGGEDVILGLPWLKKENPVIDWKKNTVELLDENSSEKELNLSRAFFSRLQESPTPSVASPESPSMHCSHIEEVPENEDVPSLLPIDDDEEEDPDTDEEETIVAYLQGSHSIGISSISHFDSSLTE
jgi:hypothetical protein